MHEAAGAWARANPPVLAGVFRSRPEDFRVTETLSFQPDGAGEFALVEVEKRGANTAYVGEALARFSGVAARAVSYAGRKDRHAVARQWFCVHLPGKPDPDWSEFESEEWKVTATARHGRKLRRGAIAENRFRLVVRELTGEQDAIEARLQHIATTGVPNYFGPQRFGRERSNLDRAEAMSEGRRLRRNQRSMALSAARAFLFNEVLSKRVETGNWDRPLEGDVWMFADGRTVFGPERVQAAIVDRCEKGEIDPTGPLWGRGELRPGGVVAELERDACGRWPKFTALVEAAGMAQERRRLRLTVRNLEWDWPRPDRLALGFGLESGAFATSVLRELGKQFPVQ